MTDLVCNYPLEELLALRWTPEDLDEDEEDETPIDTVWTKTVVVWTKTVVTVDRTSGAIGAVDGNTSSP